MLRLRPGGHDGELIQLQGPSATNANESDRKLLDTIFEMLKQDSLAEPVAVPGIADAKSGNVAELPEGWGTRGATQAGAFGDHAWNADRGPEDTWTFASVAPKPQMQFGNAASSASSSLPFGQQAPFGGQPSAQMMGGMGFGNSSVAGFGGGGMQQMQSGYAQASFDSCPSDWGSRHNQVPLNALMHRGIVQPGRDMPPTFH